MENDNIIVLNDENGDEVEFELLDYIKFDEKEFAVLLPTDGSDSVVIIRIETEDENSELETYVGATDEETAAVFEIFKVRCKDIFDFEE